MNPNIIVFDTADATVHQLAEDLYDLISGKESEYFNVAVSGGSTPLKLFNCLREYYAKTMPWEKLKIFWVDERCVSPEDPESNYGMANHYLLQHVGVPNNQIYRIKGENEPRVESRRYASLLEKALPRKNHLPRFDLILLGMGDDGHTASIFPDQKELFYSERLCEVSEHPKTRQKRITLTGKVINNADQVAFLVTGETKANALNKIINEQIKELPASFVDPEEGKLKWYVDRSASYLLFTE
jgi:6-phosphogluconolactonase